MLRFSHVSWCLLLAAAVLILGGSTPHFQRQRVTSANALLFRAPLLVDASGGTYSGTGAAKTCRTPGSSSYTELAANAVCRSATYGTRLSPAGGNLQTRSRELDDASWIKSAGVTRTASAVVGPSGAMDAERLQYAGASNYIYRDVAPGGSFGPFDEIVYGIALQTHAGGASCTIDLGSTLSIGGIFYGGLVTVTPTWQWHWTRGIAPLSGNTRFALSTFATLGHGTPTCTDIDAVDAYLGNDVTGPGAYDITGAAAVTHGAETITWPWLGRVKAARGTIEFDFDASSRASWDQYADGNFWSIPVDGGGTFATWFDKSANTCNFTAGGQTASVPCSWSPDTGGHLAASWGNGRPIEIRWNEDYPGISTGNYVIPTFTAGGSITLGGAIDGFYSDLKIWKTYRVPSSIPVTHYAPLISTLAPTYPPASAPYTYTGPAWTCLDAGGQSMSDKALNAPCYYDAGGDGRGVRVSAAVTNLVQGDMDGVDGTTPPTGWAIGANGMAVRVATVFHGQGARANMTTFAYKSLGVFAGYLFEYKKITAFVSAGYSGWSHNGTFYTHKLDRENTSWLRTGSFVTTGNPLIFYGGGSAGAPVTSAVLDYDAASASVSSYAPPFCAGVPPVTCAAESLSRAFGAELSATNATIDIYFTSMWGAGTDQGNSGINFGNARGTNAYLLSNTAYNLQWNNAARTIVLTDGVQTATSEAQTWRPDGTHHARAVLIDGLPLSISIDGQTPVLSAGNKAAQALGATTYLGTNSAGGAEGSIWIQSVMVR